MRNIPFIFISGLAASALLVASALHAAPRKVHQVVLGAAHRVPYSQAGDPAGAAPGEADLIIRALMVDGAVKEWITGDPYDVTDRSFVVRSALKINNALPGAKPDQWVWQRGPWLLVDRITGHAAALHLPDYDPAVSRASWFRDYAAYCGLTPSGKSLYAIVAQIGLRRAVLHKRLAAYDPGSAPAGVPACAEPQWQRDPARVTFRPAGNEAFTFSLVPSSTEPASAAPLPPAAQAKPRAEVQPQ